MLCFHPSVIGSVCIDGSMLARKIKGSVLKLFFPRLDPLFMQASSAATVLLCLLKVAAIIPTSCKFHIEEYPRSHLHRFYKGLLTWN